MSDKCECGSTEGPLIEDVAGLLLCPPCSSASAVHCDICGDDAPVRLYADGPASADGLSVGAPTYVAVCRICDGGAQ